MYFGSVKFFKHLIIALLMLIVSAVVFLAIWFTINLLGQSLPLSRTVVLTVGKFQEINFSAANQGTQSGVVASKPTDNSLIASDNSSSASSVTSTPSESSEDSVPAENTPTEPVIAPYFAYQELYPDMVVEAPPTLFVENPSTVYLTFDDGPSENTAEILRILDDYQIKATFFVCNVKSELGQEYIQKIYDKGHKIGIHSLSHKYTQIYSSVDAYLEDFYITWSAVKEITGETPDIFRFPGGSINNYNRFIYQQIVAEMTRRGFVYFDWNISGQDASSKATSASVYDSVRNDMIALPDDGRAIILLHDGATNRATVGALEDIVWDIREFGYTFDKLNNSIKPFNFDYR